MNRKDVLFAYQKGFVCGVKMSAVDLKLLNHENTKIAEEYKRGWEDGRHTRREHLEAAQKRIGVRFEILRGTSSEETLSEEHRWNKQ